MSDHVIAVALPWLEGPRAALLGGIGPPLPPACVLRPCTDCGLTLAVGPVTVRTLEADPTIELVCPRCGVGRCRDAEIVIEVNLTPIGPLH